MKKVLIAGTAVVLLAFSLWFVVKNFNAKWSGVDESVVEKFAEQAKLFSRKPLIDIGEVTFLFSVFWCGSGRRVRSRILFPLPFPLKSKAKSDAKSV